MNETKFLLAAIVFAMAGPVAAIDRSFDGSGDAVLLPYFHAADGESTVFTVQNYSDRVKAVRVAVNEGRNGRLTLAFNLYPAPLDRGHRARRGRPASAPGRARR